MPRPFAELPPAELSPQSVYFTVLLFFVRARDGMVEAAETADVILCGVCGLSAAARLAGSRRIDSLEPLTLLKQSQGAR
jgi:hypothetical protein